MSNFTGAALYTKEEIGQALEFYKEEVSWANMFLNKKVAYAESRYKPNLLIRLFVGKTLRARYGEALMNTYRGKLLDKGWIELTNEEYKRLDFLNYYENLHYLGVWGFEDEYDQVKNLYNGGKDCYLNPSQAAFVNKYKNFKEAKND